MRDVGLHGRCDTPGGLSNRFVCGRVRYGGFVVIGGLRRK